MKTMKQLFYFLTLTTFSVFTSCSGDDKPSISVEPTELAGEWNLTKYTSESKTITPVDNITSTITINEVGTDFKYDITFNSTANTITTEGEFFNNITINKNGEKETGLDAINPDDNLFTGPWSVDGDILKFKFKGNDVEAKITSFSDESFSISINTNEVTEDKIIKENKTKATFTK